MTRASRLTCCLLLPVACCLLLSGCKTLRRWRASADASSAERMKNMEKQMEAVTERLENLEYELRFNIASNQVSLGKYQDALKGFREVVRTNPSSSYAAASLYQTAKIYKYNLKNTEKAISTYQELLSGYPKSEFRKTALFEIAESLSELGKKTEAAEQYRKVIATAGRDPAVEKAYYQLGDLYREEKNYADAMKQYQKLIEVFPEGTLRPAALYRLAYCSLVLADTAAALKLYEQVYTEFPTADFAELSLFDRISVLMAQNANGAVAAKDAVSKYMIQYPNGRFRPELERFLEKLNRKKPSSP